MPQITGTIVFIDDVQQVSATFKKRVFAVKTDEQYPQSLGLEVVQDKTDLLDNFNEGDKVEVHINLRGREWTSPQGETKYFNTLQAWQIIKQAAPAAHHTTPPAPAPAATADFDEQEDDLPF